jgi:hypothetical protein
LACLCTIAEHTQHAAGHRRRSGLLNTTHSHAHVFAFYNDGHALGLDRLVEGQRYLLGQPLLNLKSSRERFSYAGQLR